MICLEGELRTSEIRPEVRTHYHRCQHFPAGGAISPLRQPQATAGVCDYHFPILWQLAQDPSHSNCVVCRPAPDILTDPALAYFY